MGIELLSRHIGMRDTKSNIISLSGVLEEQAIAYATDTQEMGIYTNGAWVWINSVNNLYIDQSGGTADTYGILGCTLDGSHPICTVSQGAYVSGTLLVFLNGQLQTQGTAEDWTETNPVTGTFTFATAPTATDQITVVYGFLGVSIGGGGYTQGARVYNSADVSLTNGVNTLVTFDSEAYDTDNIHESVTYPGRLTCKTSGKYIIVGNVQFTTGGNQSILYIKYNGGNYIGADSRLGMTSPRTSRVSVTTIYDLAVNDYVELWAYIDVASPYAIHTADYSPNFMMQRIG
jgi:hypothetical protein